MCDQEKKVKHVWAWKYYVDWWKLYWECYLQIEEKVHKFDLVESPISACFLKSIIHWMAWISISCCKTTSIHMRSCSATQPNRCQKVKHQNPLNTGYFGIHVVLNLVIFLSFQTEEDSPPASRYWHQLRKHHRYVGTHWRGSCTVRYEYWFWFESFRLQGVCAFFS